MYHSLTKKQALKTIYNKSQSREAYALHLRVGVQTNKPKSVNKQ